MLKIIQETIVQSVGHVVSLCNTHTLTSNFQSQSQSYLEPSTFLKYSHTSRNARQYLLQFLHCLSSLQNIQLSQTVTHLSLSYSPLSLDHVSIQRDKNSCVQGFKCYVSCAPCAGKLLTNNSFAFNEWLLTAAGWSLAKKKLC